MLLAGKRILVTGVLTPASIAFGVAARAQQEGAEVVVTSFGRSASITERTARRLPAAARVVTLDVSEPDDLASLGARVGGRLDGVVHAVAYAPDPCLGGGFLTAAWEDVATALHVSTYSLPALAVACRPLMERGGSIVALDFDSTRHAWPAYDWMGVAKAALESAARYLARDLGPSGIRVNLVAAGPLRTLAAKAIPGFDEIEDAWAARAPLGWDTRDPAPVAGACVALLSDLFPATTGEILRVDGGFHAVGV